jgi:uncharacterized protein YxjI
LKEKLSVGDDRVEDESGNKIYKVNGKLRIQETFVLMIRRATRCWYIRRDLRMRGVMKIERGGDTVATVTKKVIDLRSLLDRPRARRRPRRQGNVVDHEYEAGDGDTVATITKKWSACESYRTRSASQTSADGRGRVAISRSRGDGADDTSWPHPAV